MNCTASAILSAAGCTGCTLVAEGRKTDGKQPTPLDYCISPHNIRLLAASAKMLWFSEQNRCQTPIKMRDACSLPK